MKVIEQIHNIHLNLVTGWGLGTYPFGPHLVSLLAIGFMFFIQNVLHFRSRTVGVILLVLMILIFLMNHCARPHTDEQPLETDDLVLNPLIGMMFAFFRISIWLKLALFGFVLFHGIRSLQQFIEIPRLNPPVTLSPTTYAFFDSIATGIAVNLFIRLTKWIMR